jgi:transcriptional regulator with XRE-family HTH domain
MDAARRHAGPVLREMRRHRRLSQLELSLRVGVSQRHLSCLETGRAAPSRAMLLALLDALDAPLPERNRALLAAGYAPQFVERGLDDPQMAPVRQAIDHLLAAHEPAPALVLDAGWNLLRTNAAAQRLVGWLGMVPQPGMNMLRATLVPGPLRRALINADEVIPEVWYRAQREAPHHAPLAALLHELAPHAPPPGGAPATASPVLGARLATARGELAFFSTFTTFGSPLEITTASLRVEHLFPADDRTRDVLAAAA